MALPDRVIEGVVIACGGGCGLACRRCPVPGAPERSTAAVKKDVAAAAARKAGRVVFSGGDPLLRKDFAGLAAFARSKRLKVGVATNARLLLYPAQRAALRAAGLDSVIVAPLAGDEETRTRGAFVQTLAAVRELQKLPGLTVEVRVPVGKGFDREAGRLLQGLGQKRGCYLALYDPGASPPDEAAAAVSHALSACARAGLPAGYEDLPPCLMGHDGESELRAGRLQALGADDATCLGLPGPAGYIKVLLCSECARETSCRGVPRRAVELFAFDAVKPARAVRSNSFDYTFERELRGFRPAAKACRGDSLLKGGPPQRAVYLQKGKKVSLYRADTNSFTDEELRAVKYFREQLYVDVSAKAMLDDPQRDVRQLGMGEICRGCAKKERCGACYGELPDTPFEREERWLRQEIRRLAGRVLDIGCGDLRFYRDTVADLLARDRIEYHGLDVDKRALAELEKRHPKAHVHRSPIEGFSFQAGYFDYIFALRSLNHFRDLDRSFAAMTELLKDQGMLIMAECVPFGLLRSRRQTARARSAEGPGFEHYRNWSSEQVLEFVRKKGFPFKLNTHRPVRPGTSNQWLLKFIKIPDA